MKKLITLIIVMTSILQLTAQNIEKKFINLQNSNSILNDWEKPNWGGEPLFGDEFGPTIEISNPYSYPYHDNPNLDMVNEKWHWCPSWGIADYNAPYYCKKDNIETTVYSEPDANNYIKLWTKYEPDGFEHPNPSNYNDYYPTYTLFTLNNGFSEKKQKNFI